MVNTREYGNYKFFENSVYINAKKNITQTQTVNCSVDNAYYENQINRCSESQINDQIRQSQICNKFKVHIQATDLQHS